MRCHCCQGDEFIKAGFDRVQRQIFSCNYTDFLPGITLQLVEMSEAERPGNENELLVARAKSQSSEMTCMHVRLA